MKINKMTLLLVIGLISIWGGIVYLVFSHFQEKPQLLASSKPGNSNLKEEMEYTLLLNYKDPFFVSKAYKAVQKTKSDPPKSGNIPVKMAPPSPVLSINFRLLGYINSDYGQNKMIVLSVNGEERIVQQDDIIKGYNIHVNKDGSITLQKGKEKLVLAAVNR